MNVFLKIETYVVALIVGALSHWLTAHPGMVDPFYSGTLVGAIVHAIGHSGGGGDSPAPPRIGGSG